MRALMVSPSYYPIKGGAETVIRGLSIELNKIGVQTEILTFNMNRKWNPFWQAKVEKVDGINIYKIPALNWFPLEHSARITMGINLIPGRFRKYLKENEVIHFHVGDLTFPFFSYTVKKPKVIQLHGPLGFYKRYFLSKVILKKTADLYIAISQQMKRELAELGIESSRIRYLPNSVDTRIFQPTETKDDNLILFVGRITFGKGLHVLLRSLRYIKTKIHLVIIGTSDWDVPYFQQIKKQIELENKRKVHKIEYLGGQERANIAKWCKKASVFVLPSFREAFPMTILEALSCGTPVVATNVGGIPDAVRDGKNGILIPPNNPVELAKSIQYLLDNKSIRTNFGREGRRIIIDNFSNDLIVEKLCGIYKELL